MIPLYLKGEAGPLPQLLQVKVLPPTPKYISIISNNILQPRKVYSKMSTFRIVRSYQTFLDSYCCINVKVVDVLLCLLLYILLASLIDGSASYFEIISGTEHCRDKSSGRFHQSVPSVACNHTRACFASEDIFNNDIIQNMTAIFFFNSYFHIQRHNNVCFFSLYCKDASNSSCLLSTLVFGHHRQW